MPDARNAEARAALLKEFGALTAAGREGLIAVEHHGTLYYPGFQFDSAGRPRAVVREVLRHLRAPPWEQALWFTSANGWLNGRRPVDLLDDHGDAVVAAAREALREPVG